MERDLNSQQPSPSVLCRSGCGFYGCPASDGFCSKCFKDILKRKNDVPTPSVSSVRNSPPASPSTGAAVLLTVQKCETDAHPPASTSAHKADGTAECKVEPTKADSIDVKTSEKPSEAIPIGPTVKEVSKTEGTKKPNRCHVCRKKVGLTGFDCRCNGLFCGEHRYSDKHNCTFDYKTLGQEEIRKNNPAVVAEKIIKL